VSADTLPGTYRFASREQATTVAGLARKGGYVATNPVLWKGRWVITIRVKKSDTTRARSTGTHVTLERGDDLPWMLICDEHSGCMEFESKRAALSARPYPDTWCEWCMGNEEEIAS